VIENQQAKAVLPDRFAVGDGFASFRVIFMGNSRDYARNDRRGLWEVGSPWAEIASLHSRFLRCTAFGAALAMTKGGRSRGWARN